jgi:hypothetical protein
MPKTKELLAEYVLEQYEEDADISDESLKREFIWLYENNELSRLFISEYIHSQDRLRDEANAIT